MAHLSSHSSTCTAFAGTRRIASGAWAQVALAVKQAQAQDEAASILIFDDATARPVEFDLRGSDAEIEARIAQAEADAAAHACAAETEAETATDDAAPRGRGRPKLGVVAREVTLLPRHWTWLNEQSGGASVALRKLVDAARSASEHKDRMRHAQEAAYRFMTALAGNLPDYEEATRALYKPDAARFDALTQAWPADVRDYARRLAQSAFADAAAAR